MLKIENLKAEIDGKQILRGVNLDVGKAEVHALMGPNGSGKSTLAAVLAGHPNYQVTSGKVTLFAKDLLEMSPDQRAQAGLFLAFQHPVEVPGVKVWQFLRRAHQARFAEESKKKFQSALSFRQYLENLAEELKMNPELVRRGLNEGFSGGEKKRLEMLQMLVLEPVIAVLDETDSGLDMDALKIVGQVVARAKRDFKTGFLVITHYQRILDHVKPDKVHVFIDGKISESGTAELVTRLELKGYQQ